MRTDLRPRTLGEIIGLTFALSVAHFGKLFPIALVVSAPSVALSFSDHAIDSEAEPGLALLFTLGGLVLATILWPLGSAASIKIVAASYTGTPCTLGEGLRAGLRRAVPLFGCSLAVGILVGLGALLFLVPGLMAMVAYYVAPCAVVLENRGVGAAMRRSSQLSAGHRWRIFFLVVVVTVLVQVIPGIIFGMLIEVGFAGLAMFVAMLVVMAALGLPTMIAPVVAFFDLRVRKEAFDVTALAELVDQIGQGVPRPASV